MKKIRKLIGEEIHDYLEESLKWVIMSLLIGIPCGLLGTLFHHSLRKANALRAAHPWLLFTLPADRCPDHSALSQLRHAHGWRYKPHPGQCAQERTSSAARRLHYVYLHNSDAAGWRQRCRTAGEGAASADLAAVSEVSSVIKSAHDSTCRNAARRWALCVVWVHSSVRCSVLR